MDVTDILRDRMREPEGFQRMAVVSAVMHVLLIAMVLFVPGNWFGASAPEARNVITISFGGSPGPSTGGMNQIGAQPVQEAIPPEAAPRRPEPPRAPAAKQPEMTVPAPNAPRRPTTPAPRVTQAPDGATGRTPTRGAEVKEGTAIGQTGAQGTGTGLSQGGGGNGMQTDVADFCCPDYLRELNDRIRSNWNDRLGLAGKVTIRFTIQRDGRLTDASVFAPSYEMLNQQALRAVLLTKQARPLPLEFPNQTLGIRLTFEYER